MIPALVTEGTLSTTISVFGFDVRDSTQPTSESKVSRREDHI